MAADPATEQLDRDILGFIHEGFHRPQDQGRFNALALRLFAYQFERNPVYRNFCRARGATPDSVRRWLEIPAVPTMAFNEMPLACFPIERAAAVYLSSGTTASRPSRHYLETLDLYDASLLVSFKACVAPDAASMPIFILAPPGPMLPHSSLTHMLEAVKAALGAPGSDFFMDERGLQAERLAHALAEAEREGTPVCLLGTAFAFVHFLDWCGRSGLGFLLPAGSRIMDTGGYKGKSREAPKAELHRLYEATLGIPPHHVVNEYGMTELGSQFYDNCLLHVGQFEPRRKLAPPWARTLVVDPETLEPVAQGKIGLLRHYDLANRSSVMAIQTDDLGVQIAEGFEILGRARDAEARGCSLAVEEFLSQAR